ncbi:hypothetical protein EPUL_002382, partial [Erysiphe pulchra]
MPNQAVTFKIFDGNNGKDVIKEIFEHDSRNYFLGSDNAELYTETSEYVSNNAESYEKPNYTYDTMNICEKISKKKPWSEGKAFKKSGRKPITSEPSTKRKAQNRVAQRAFRERREKYQKDLELKVLTLQKISESISKENKILHERMGNLLAQLQEYHNRLLLSEGTKLCGNNSFNINLNQNSQDYHQNQSELSIDSKFSCPQGQAMSMDEIKKKTVTYCMKPILHSHNTEQIDLDQSLVIKASQKDLTQAQIQPTEIDNLSLSNHYMSRIPEIGNYDDFKFGLFSSDRKDSKENLENSNRLSSRAEFTKSKISYEHEKLPNLSTAPMNDRNDLFQSALKLNFHPKFNNEISESLEKTTWEENSGVTSLNITLYCDQLAHTNTI